MDNVLSSDTVSGPGSRPGVILVSGLLAPPGDRTETGLGAELHRLLCDGLELVVPSPVHVQVELKTKQCIGSIRLFSPRQQHQSILVFRPVSLNGLAQT